MVKLWLTIFIFSYFPSKPALGSMGRDATLCKLMVAIRANIKEMPQDVNFRISNITIGPGGYEIYAIEADNFVLISGDAHPIYLTMANTHKADLVGDFMAPLSHNGEKISGFFGHRYDPATKMIYVPSTQEVSSRLAQLNNQMAKMGLAPVQISFVDESNVISALEFTKKWANEGQFVRADMKNNLVTGAHDANSHFGVTIPETIANYTRSVGRKILTFIDNVEKLKKTTILTEQDIDFLTNLQKLMAQRYSAALDNTIISTEVAWIYNGGLYIDAMDERLVPNRMLQMFFDNMVSGQGEIINYSLFGFSEIKRNQTFFSASGLTEMLLDSILQTKNNPFRQLENASDNINSYLHGQPNQELIAKLRPLLSATDGDEISEEPFDQYVKRTMGQRYDTNKSLAENLYEEVKQRTLDIESAIDKLNQN